jgi:hypothetical protein
VVVVLVPADACAAAGGFGDSGRVDHAAERHLEEPRQVRRALAVGERDRLLGRKRGGPRAGFVLHVSAGGLRVQPLAHVALTDAGLLRELGRRQRTGAGQATVQTELVAHHHQRGVEGGADLADGAEYELL